MTRVTLDDMRKAGVCPGSAKAPGARDWFRDCGLDFKDFARNGIDAETLLSTGKANADVLRVIETARARNGR